MTLDTSVMVLRIRMHGFTLIETVATLTVISLIAVGLVTMSGYLLNYRQRIDTIDRMNDLRKAISGNPVIVQNEARTSFGYLGDMGNVPTSLQDLWVKPSGCAPNQPPCQYVFDTTLKTGAGWNGPYVEMLNTQGAAVYALDGWGNGFTYTTFAGTDATFGSLVMRQLRSLGPSYSAGAGDNISVDFFQSEVLSRVQGYVKDSKGNAVSGAGITINYPSNGVLTSQNVFADTTGYYFATGIPFGNRSITINPLLVLADGTVKTGGSFSGGYTDVTFTVKNFSPNAITVTALQLGYPVAPNNWFNEIDVGGKKVWKLGDPGQAVRFGDPDNTGVQQCDASMCDYVSFMTVPAVSGTGASLESVPIRIQSPVTDVPDLSIGNVGKGGTMQIQFKGFNAALTGTGSQADVTGTDFFVTLYDSNNNIVGTVTVSP